MTDTPATGPKLRAWILTDGKAGDEVPCIGIAEALGAIWERRRVAPRRPWVWAMPWGPIDPREAPDRPGSPIAPPYPDLVIACGRRAVAYARAVKRRAGRDTFVVFLRDPRTRRHGADLLWVPSHDRPRGPDVVVTPTTPHRMSRDRLAAARAAPPERLAALPHPRVAVVLGGGEGLGGLAPKLAALASSAGSFMVTPSRRTEPELLESVRAAISGRPSFVWDGRGENPYVAILALADTVVVTGDSHNMVSEATATGVPVLVQEPLRLSRKLRAFLAGLRAEGAVRTFEGRFENYTYEPQDATASVAREIALRLARNAASRRSEVTSSDRSSR